jgi:hypothetical protein
MESHVQFSENKHTQRLNKIYLLYLGLLPSLGTFAVLLSYGTRVPFLVFLGGVAAVGVYLAATYSYTPIPNHLWVLLLMFIDGPIFVLISLREGLNPLAFAIEGYLLDGTAIWLSILFLALISPLPTPNQRIGSVFFMLVAFGITTSLFWPYFQEFIWGKWPKMIWLLIGVLEATWLHFRRFSREAIARGSSDFSILFIAGLVMLWVFSMIAGNVLHEVGVRL